MDTVDAIRGDIHCALETKGHIRAPDIVVDGLGERDNIEPFFAEQIGCLMGTVAAEDYQAIQLHLLVIVLHVFDPRCFRR